MQDFPHRPRFYGSIRPQGYPVKQKDTLLAVPSRKARLTANNPRMTPQQIMRMALDPAVILEAQGLTPDPWQKQFLVGHHRKVLLCCTRGAGKSRSTSALALHTARFTPNSLESSKGTMGEGGFDDFARHRREMLQDIRGGR